MKNYQNVNNSNDSRILAEGHRAELGGGSSFTDYLNSSYKEVVARLRLELSASRNYTSTPFPALSLSNNVLSRNLWTELATLNTIV